MHTLTNVKNFAEARLDLFKPLTILLGRNGSGKTNLIEGIELFSALVGGTPLNEISDVDGGGNFEIRGGLGGCIRFGQKKTRMRFHRARVRVESSPQLFRNGANLSSVLFALRNGSEEQRAALKRITEVVRQIPEEPFTKIDFVETRLGDVMAAFARAEDPNINGNSLLDARILSDGTLRMLAIITAAETVPERSRMVIEEFDNGLHPSRAELMVHTFERVAERRRLNILLTTHNPAFMDALSESHFDSVLISHCEDTNAGFRLTPLSELDVSKTISLQGGLGDFVTSG